VLSQRRVRRIIHRRRPAAAPPPHPSQEPQTNGVIERFFGTLKYEHLYRGPINDGDALAVEVNRFRQIYNTIRPHQALHDRTPRDAYLAGR
jgi:transposase InsO family protein